MTPGQKVAEEFHMYAIGGSLNATDQANMRALAARVDAAVKAERERWASWSDVQREAVRAVIAAELKRGHPDVPVGYRSVTAANIADAVEEALAAAIKGEATP